MSKSPRGKISAPRLNRNEIVAAAEALAETFLCEYWKGEKAERFIGINFDLVYDYLIYPEYGILLIEDEDLGEDEEGDKIFGRFDPISNTAFIDCSLRTDPRRIFTCWHEVGGHGVFQGDWLRKRVQELPNQAVITTESMLSFDTVNILERQANIFAAHAGVPSGLLALAILDDFDPYRKMEYRGPGTYSFSVRGHSLRREVKSFSHFAWTIASFLQYRFGGMSVEAISYRLLQMPLILNSEPQRFELHRTDKRRAPSAVGNGSRAPAISRSGNMSLNVHSCLEFV